MASTKASITRTKLSGAIISSSGVANRPNCWRFCPVRWAMLFSLVLLVPPPGGDGSKIARFGEWHNGEGDCFHNLTVGLLPCRHALDLRAGCSAAWTASRCYIASFFIVSFLIALNISCKTSR